MRNKSLLHIIALMIIIFILISVAPVIATDTSIAGSIGLGEGNTTYCPTDNGNGYAYGAWEYNWKCHIPQAFSEVENLTINTTIIDGTPHWIFLAAGAQEKQAFLNYIDSANVSEKQKNNWTQFIRTMWKEHPVEFDNSTGNPTLVPGKSSVIFSLTCADNATFQEIEQLIADDMEKTRTEEITVKWYAEPTHRTFMNNALDTENIPGNLKTIAANAAPEPDYWPMNNIPVYQQINHGYVPGVAGLAPTNFGFYTYNAKLMYISHDYSGAFTNMGYASHFITDLGNPYHTPPVQLIPLEYLDMPFSQIVFPNSQMILNYKTLHDGYEDMVANNWDMFYNGNRDRYEIYEPTTSATIHGTTSWGMSYPLIYGCYWHFINNNRTFNFETNPAIVGITQNRVVESMKHTRGLVRYVTGGQYPTLTITATAGPGGSISPSGDVSVRYSEGQSFTITPGAGYGIDKILVDGNPVTQNPYEFNSVTSDHTITATFIQNLPAIVPLCPAGSPFDASKYPQNTLQSEPMTFTCTWDGNGRVYLSGDQSSLIGTFADDGFTVDTPNRIQFDAKGHWAHQHPPLELTQGMNEGSNTLRLIVRNWAGLSMSYGSFTGTGTNQVPYIIEVNAPTTAVAVEKPTTDEFPSFIKQNGMELLVNGTTISDSLPAESGI